ncbi:MAG: tetratricopeptide repeat protein [Parcubacteria group bacterium]|nr:tetratricopeptide repeat protein [Parcubacteria group bacterium]
MREKWEGLEDEVLRKNKSGTRTLFIPKDLQLWEMVGVMERVDRDTFQLRPEIAIEKRGQLRVLGKTFQDAGVYIAQRLEFISEGRNIAEALAEEFYAYGGALISGEKPGEDVGGETMRTLSLTQDETEKVDRWLAGEPLYVSRRARVEKLKEMNSEEARMLLEQERQRTLAQFFRVAEKAFELKQKSEDGTLSSEYRSRLKPWQSDTPLHSAFLAKVYGNIKNEIETPKRELVETIFRRGLEFLQRNMGVDKVPKIVKEEILHWEGGEKTLREALRIDRLEEELMWVRACGSLESIGQKEHEIIQQINQAISVYRHQGGDSPSEMVIEQRFNCLGGSLLAGALLGQVGINYLVVDAPEHSLLFVVRSDGVIEWRDMINSTKGKILDDTMFKKAGKEKTPITVRDLIAFSEHPGGEGLALSPKSRVWENQFWWMDKEQRGTITVFGPEYGQKIQVLYNLGTTLNELGYKKEAVEAYKEMIALNPKMAESYYGLGNALSSLGRHEEALEVYRKAIALNPEDADFYQGLGNALLDLDRNEEAIEAYRKAIALAPQGSGPYSGLGSALRNLHRDKEALKAFRQFIARADRYDDRELTETMRKIIMDLQKKLEN